MINERMNARITFIYTRDRDTADKRDKIKCNETSGKKMTSDCDDRFFLLEHTTGTNKASSALQDRARHNSLVHGFSQLELVGNQRVHL